MCARHPRLGIAQDIRRLVERAIRGGRRHQARQRRRCASQGGVLPGCHLLPLQIVPAHASCPASVNDTFEQNSARSFTITRPTLPSGSRVGGIRFVMVGSSAFRSGRNIPQFRATGPFQGARISPLGSPRCRDVCTCGLSRRRSAGKRGAFAPRNPPRGRPPSASRLALSHGTARAWARRRRRARGPWRPSSAASEGGRGGSLGGVSAARARPPPATIAGMASVGRARGSDRPRLLRWEVKDHREARASLCRGRAGTQALCSREASYCGAAPSCLPSS